MWVSALHNHQDEAVAKSLQVRFVERCLTLGSRIVQICDGAPALVRIPGNYVHSLPTHTLYRSSSIPGCSTNWQKNSLPYSLCTAFLPRHSQYSPCVCIKHQACRNCRRGAEHFKAESAFCGGWQNSQMAPTGQRTIPPADAPKATGLEHSFLLLLLLLPPCPPHPASSLPTFIS